jgi:hypothetical protein
MIFPQKSCILTVKVEPRLETKQLKVGSKLRARQIWHIVLFQNTLGDLPECGKLAVITNTANYSKSL